MLAKIYLLYKFFQIEKNEKEWIKIYQNFITAIIPINFHIQLVGEKSKFNIKFDFSEK